MWCRLLVLAIAAQVAVSAQPKGVDKGLQELQAYGSTIAKLVETKNWPALLEIAPLEYRDWHAKDLQDPHSDFYCFLIDATCNENWKGRQSVYHILALAHSLGVAAIGSGPSPAQAATLFFYDRSEISLSDLRSDDFLCKKDGWKKVAYWSFRIINGKWMAIGPVFEYATDSLCN